MAKVSVVVTAYNSIKYLPEALESVFWQTYQDIEVIVVDDGSTDGTLQWLSEIKESKNIKVVAQENQGVATARNTGISNANGEYIAFLDGDDIWEPEKLELQLAKFEQDENIYLVHSWLASMSESGEFTGKVFATEEEGYIWDSVILKNMITCSSVMLKKACFEHIEPFDTKLTVAEDWDLWLRIAARFKIAVVKKPLVRYRQHLGSKSKRYPDLLNDFRIIIEKGFETAPIEKLYLRSTSYANVYVMIAWKCIQGLNKDCDKAEYFCQQALLNDGRIRYTKEFINLSTSIFLMKRLGEENYARVLKLFYGVRNIAGKR